MPNISFAGAKKRKTRHSGYIFRMARQEPGVTQMGLAPSGLLSLVDELLLSIVDQIDAHETLCNLAATCMRFQGLIEPYIWRSLLVLKGDHARRIATALDSRADRMDFIQELAIRYKDEYRDGIEELNHFMAFMTRLRHLTIETPCPNNSEWRRGMYFDGWSRIDYTNLLAAAVYPRVDIPLALPVLQSLTLHAHNAGTMKFVLGRAVAMFAHPTLRKITLSCLNFDGKLDPELLAEKGRKWTPLQSLTLVECNVNVPFLEVILGLPKALKELSIGERLFTFDECEPSMDAATRTSSRLFLTALQQQADSLKSLVHVGGKVAHMTPRRNDPDGAAKLRSLVNLEYLELGFESHLYYYLRQDGGFPPALKTLKMVDAAISLNAGHDLESSSDIAFRSLTSLVTEHLPLTLNPSFKLQLKYHDHSFFRLLAQTAASFSEQSHLLNSLFFDRPSVYRIARILQTYHASFLVTRETFPSGVAYIPPFMHGEELPVEEPMYDSAAFWQFNGIDYRVIDDKEMREEMRKKGELVCCIECRDYGIEECFNTGDGSRCLDCRRRMQRCGYVRDEEGRIVSAV
ncbi:hypothetical protein T440DRAFT_454467 [Plenodomus tracheiphilus IPT5]|uniref:F-box domain-containing protein n=1 Tax=Plenodomus tracheiphilus IPT5 TaxID=1408161 RepID=A0A6A7AYJ1_9PLEO|nr:hypothetical protein T440DRAFT_454467 [Plenodomus tracheiphilus IPT5]